MKRSIRKNEKDKKDFIYACKYFLTMFVGFRADKGIEFKLANIIFHPCLSGLEQIKISNLNKQIFFKRCSSGLEHYGSAIIQLAQQSTPTAS